MARDSLRPRDGSPDECVGRPCNAAVARSPAATHLPHATALRCWPTEHAIRIAAVARALLRLRQDGLACSLRYGAALWLHSSARIPDARAKPKRIAARRTSGCALSGTDVAS